MNERALTPVSVGADTAPDLAAPQPESPGTRLLDALRAGDDRAVVAEIGQTTTVMAENLPWGCRGPDEVDTMLREARERFPGLVFEATARRVGFGLVIEEGRVRDVEAEVTREIEQAEARHPSTPAGGTDDDDHPMWDHPDTHPGSKDLVLWRERHPRCRTAAAAQPAGPGDRPTRRPPGPRGAPELSGRAVQASAGALGRPARDVAERGAVGVHRAGRRRASRRTPRPARADRRPGPPVAEPAPTRSCGDPRRRRRGGLVLLVLVVLALLAAAGWWSTQVSSTTSTGRPQRLAGVRRAGVTPCRPRVAAVGRAAVVIGTHRP